MGLLEISRVTLTGMCVACLLLSSCFSCTWCLRLLFWRDTGTMILKRLSEKITLTKTKQRCYKLELERLRSEYNTPPPPPPPPWLPILLVHIGSQVRTRQSKKFKFEEFVKISNFWILTKSLHMKHLLKLFDKICKYKMDPESIV